MKCSFEMLFDSSLLSELVTPSLCLVYLSEKFKGCVRLIVSPLARAGKSISSFTKHYFHSSDSADKVVQGEGKFEEIVVASNEITASTVQLVSEASDCCLESVVFSLQRSTDTA